MVITVSSLLRAGVAVSLLAVIAFSAVAPPPSGRAVRVRPSALIALAAVLYAVGILLAVLNLFGLAGFTCVTGIALFAVATWLSRPADSGEPPSDGRGDDDDPPARAAAPART